MSNIDSNKVIDGYTLGQNHVIENLWLHFSRNNEGFWVIGIKEAIQLHSKLKKLQPKHILELGTGIGCSAAIMAFTCPDAHIYTVESNQVCIDLAEKFVPKSLRERITFKKSESRISSPIYEINPFVYWSIYNEYAWIDYDFIFIDGPGPFIAKVPHKDREMSVLAELPGGDVIFLLHNMRGGTIVYVDQRIYQTLLYQRHLSEYLKIVEVGDRYTMFQRTNKALAEDFSDFVNNDKTYNALRIGGYFNKPNEKE